MLTAAEVAAKLGISPRAVYDIPISVVVDAGHVGRVRIYYRRMRYRHYRSSHWAWVVNRAEPRRGEAAHRLDHRARGGENAPDHPHPRRSGIRRSETGAQP